jgi:hypothetical protein
MSLRCVITTITALAMAFSPVVPAVGQERPLPSDVGPTAVSGQFVMQSCGETGEAHGWTSSVNTNDAALAMGVDCPPSTRPPGYPESFQQAGVWLSDRLGNAGGAIGASSGDRAEMTLSAATGTSIARLRYWRAVHKAADPGDHWQPYISLGARGDVIDSCLVGSDSTCYAGGDDWFPDDATTTPRAAYRDLDGLSVPSLIVGLYCTLNEDDICGSGNSLTSIDVEIFSAFLTISDAAAPILGTPVGEGWTATGWIGGDLALALASMDNTGIAATKVYVDGSLVRTLQRQCSYDRPRPCSDEPVGAVGLSTAAVADGVHQVSLGAVDAAGNETEIERPTPLRVDNNAPAAPVGLVSPAPVSTVDRFSVHWALPPDAGSPIVAAKYQVCQAGACGVVQTAPSLTAVEDVVLPEAGVGSVRVWLVDSLGQEAPSGAGVLNIDYAPEPAQGPAPGEDPPPGQGSPPAVEPPALTVPPGTTPPSAPRPVSGGDPSAPPSAAKPAKKPSPALKITSTRVAGRRVIVRGTVSARASGRVTVRFRARVKGKTYTITARARIRAKAFQATLTLPHALDRTRSGTATVSYTGDGDTRAESRRATIRWRG